MLHILFYITIAFLLSFLITYGVVRLFSRKEICIDCGEADKPQRVHDVPTPRAGGVGIFISFACVLLFSTSDPSRITSYSFLIFSALPAFLVGLYEDMRSNVSPKMRLLIIGAGSIIAMVTLNVILNDLDFFALPLWIGVPFTLFAVTGVTNAINIVDGFNGLAAGVSIIALLFFTAVAYMYNDYFLMTLTSTLTFSILGFLVWNFPKGKIFLGDGGAYFIGFMLAVISVFLLNRHTEISVWYPLLTVAYPVFEVLFSIYRRKIKRGGAVFAPDGIHLHTLVHKRISRTNSGTSPYLWFLAVLFNVFAFFFRTNPFVLIAIFLLFCLSYIYIYQSLVRFKRGYMFVFLYYSIAFPLAVAKMFFVEMFGKHPIPEPERAREHAGKRAG